MLNTRHASAMRDLRCDIPQHSLRHRIPSTSIGASGAQELVISKTPSYTMAVYDTSCLLLSVCQVQSLKEAGHSVKPAVTI